MLTDDNKIVTSTIWVGQSLAFMQCNNVISLAGQHAASHVERLLIYFNFPSTLCDHQNTMFHQINGSDKLECYTCGLSSELRKYCDNGHGPQKLTYLGVLKGMTK